MGWCWRLVLAVGLVAALRLVVALGWWWRLGLALGLGLVLGLLLL